MEINEPEALRNEPEATSTVLIAKPVAGDNFRHPAPYVECRLPLLGRACLSQELAPPRVRLPPVRGSFWPERPLQGGLKMIDRGRRRFHLPDKSSFENFIGERTIASVHWR